MPDAYRLPRHVRVGQRPHRYVITRAVFQFPVLNAGPLGVSIWILTVPFGRPPGWTLYVAPAAASVAPLGLRITLGGGIGIFLA